MISKLHHAIHRPRVEGDREQQILETALKVMAEVGYDRLTMDAVATRARASKATLYRRWAGKANLVIDALLSQKEEVGDHDTGSLRGDLLATFCGHGGLTDAHQVAILGSVVTAIARDADFAEAFRREFIGPKSEIARVIFERALARGEVRDDIDFDVLIPALPGIVLHRQFLLGDLPTPDLVARVIDQVILPAVTPAATDHLTKDSE
ncbi:TetR/AcrR family transcriptional regulator [Nocardioides sp.]|uniref:TetR/AcrR family transcriptional regulator n=1 Tax=Nocardioides sp. TaxID=35761 RepID=UPI0039E213FE